MATETPEAIPALPTTHRQHNASLCPPEKRKAILEHLKSGTGILATASITNSSPNTVQAVRDQSSEWRQEQSATLKRFTRMLTHSMVNMSQEELAAIPLQQRSISLGVVIDKIQMLDGEPTQIIEHKHSLDLTSLKSSLGVTDEIVVTPLESSLDNQALTEPNNLQLPQ